MNKLFKFLKKNQTAGKYISSGLLVTATQAISGFVILRWLDPSSLGQWQSFTVFVGYIQILTLGTTSGLGRELPYWLGKSDIELGMRRLQTTGYFTTMLSFLIMVLVVALGLVLFITKKLSLDNTLMLIFAFSTGALSIQTNFLGATYRSAQSFEKLSKIQLFNSSLYFLLLPLIYFFNLWGYIAYQVVLAIALYLGYQLFRPYKIKFKFEISQFKELVKVGFPIYFWNYISGIIRTIPRLILVVFGSPLLVGLYSPAGSINSAMLSLPGYINRYIFPKITFMLGKTEDPLQVYNYTIKASKILFSVMLLGATLIAFIIPPVFSSVFPKYIDGILPAQITLFSGVFFSINSLIHLGLNSLKVYKPFKYIVSLRFIYIVTFTYIAFVLSNSLILAVAIGSVCSEIFILMSYLYYFKKEVYKYSLIK